uniref:Beta-glucosidase-related glycosidases n=1 Tax=uncultured bacterium scaffold00056 TaxID=1132475 RepID=I6ZMD5_9BACT|nr:beta-glucosidase-related glycosidases [uncultured bacterium scaffold00056]
MSDKETQKMLGTAIYIATGKITGKLPCPETAEAARRAAEGGMVLLKNDGTLPMEPRPVALFGAGAEDTTVCGTGSGYAFSPYTVSVRRGLENAGFSVTSGLWLQNYAKEKKLAEKAGKKLSFIEKRFSGETIHVPDTAITDAEIRAASSADTAIYVIRRTTGEGYDRRAVKGDYYLSDIEENNLRKLAASFKHVVVILNTCVIDASVLEGIPGISAILLMGQAGMEAGNALAGLLTGKVAPSGRLTDTWAKRYEDYPASATFSVNDGQTLQEDYTEDIFVGYRHFDTKALDVVYPFGYGLSYTSFAYQAAAVTADWEKVTVRLTVENTGKYAGREVVQVYVSAPNGRLPKPYQELKGYAKTGLLQPGKSEALEITFDTAALASYDESKAAWVMEPGDYLLRVGAHSRATEVAAVLRLEGEAVVCRLSSQLAPDHALALAEYPARPEENTPAPVIELSARDCRTVDGVGKMERAAVITAKARSGSTLLDVADGKVSMEEFVASLDTETLLRIVTGSGSETKHPVPSRLPKGAVKSKFAGSASGKTTNQYAESLGIPAAALADGPAGLHLMGQPATTYPVGMVAAQTWDAETLYEIGDCYGKEMEHYNVAIILGPGMNIHRDPLCGRSFEYYSEDPLLTGRTAAAFTRGLQEKHPGYGVAIKHFAANNQEIDRHDMNATVSERALREIYLKGFEICVREAKPLTVMTSYNRLNGRYTSSRYDLLTDILRGEWGFEGFVMSDWDTHSEKPFDYQAGNDIVMGGYPTDVIAAAISGKPARFDKDGAIHQDRIAMYGGVLHRTVDAWNSFAPEPGGRDTLTVRVEQGVKLSGHVNEAVKSGIASVTENADGSKTVTYTGTNRGAYLSLGDIQRCAMHVLKVLMENAPMKISRKG